MEIIPIPDKLLNTAKNTDNQEAFLWFLEVKACHNVWSPGGVCSLPGC